MKFLSLALRSYSGINSSHSEFSFIGLVQLAVLNLLSHINSLFIDTPSFSLLLKFTLADDLVYR